MARRGQTKTQVYESDFFDLLDDDSVVDENPLHLSGWPDDAKLSIKEEAEKTVDALEYIFNRQGYDAKNIICSFDEKAQVFKIAFIDRELFKTQTIKSLINTINNFSEERHAKTVHGVETWEYTLPIERLEGIVFRPKFYVRSTFLLHDVLEYLDYLDLGVFDFYLPNAIATRFVIKNKMLRIEFTDPRDKVVTQVEGYIDDIGESFLILTSLDQEMADFLVSLNEAPLHDRLIRFTRYTIEVEGQRRFDFYEGDTWHEHRVRELEDLPWVRTWLRNRKIDALLEI